MSQVVDKIAKRCEEEMTDVVPVYESGSWKGSEVSFVVGTRQSSLRGNLKHSFKKVFDFILADPRRKFGRGFQLGQAIFFASLALAGIACQIYTDVELINERDTTVEQLQVILMDRKLLF